MSQVGKCHYCGERVPFEGEKLKNHVLTCPHHPMRRVETELAEALEALREARVDVLGSIEAAGPCDHAVGICTCGSTRKLERIDAILAKHPAAS